MSTMPSERSGVPRGRRQFAAMAMTAGAADTARIQGDSMRDRGWWLWVGVKACPVRHRRFWRER
jgi:hypothetical protein